MKFNNQVSYTLDIDDYIDKAFKHIPANAFIDKGRCGIGGTTLELKDKTRHSIIVVPTTGIIEDKTVIENEDDQETIELKQNIFPIKSGVTTEHVKDYLKTPKKARKIIVTPDSFEKIIKASEKLGILDKLYKNYFLLIDESHSLVTEDFRKKILSPLKYLWEFDKKSFISATPYIFSDPNMSRLSYHKIDFPKEEKLGNMLLIETKQPQQTLQLFLQSQGNRKENLHVFFNSVTQITEAIKNSKITDCNIFCSENERNFETMGEESVYFKPKPNNEFAKINFYTAKYTEGWDLKDINGMLILVTDVYLPHTKVGLSNKGVQAFGRERTKNSKLIHLTNHRNINQMKTQKDLEKEYYLRAELNLEHYNKRLALYRENSIQPNQDELDFIKQYADLDKETKVAEIATYKIDQMVNKQFCDEQFNHIDFIKKAWEDELFTVSLKRDNPDKREISKTGEKRISKANKLEGLIRKLKSLDDIKDEFLFSLTDSTIQALRNDNEEAFNFYSTLGFEECEKLKFNVRSMKRAMIEKQSLHAEVKVLKYLANEFQTYAKYSKKDCKTKLQNIYDKVGIKRTATAEQLGESGRFEIKESKMKDSKGNLINCFIILRAQFDLKMVA